ncbi:MAG: macro domain-containing protein [Prolixibacteraceae bacterium]
MEKEINGTQIELVQGDITRQEDIDAIVNAANAKLLRGGGVAGAIHGKAGPDLEKESSKLGPIKPGQAVITGAYNLPNKFVIHCLGPVYGRDEPSDKLLADCYRNVLKIAEEEKISSVAFPAISTGAFGYPAEEAAEVAFKTIRENIAQLHHVKTIRMVLFSKNDLSIHENKFSEIFND